MIRRRTILFTASGLALAIAASIGMLFWYYQPTVEYAYVDILDFRENPDAPYWVVGYLGALTVIGVAVWWWLRRRKRNKNG